MDSQIKTKEGLLKLKIKLLKHILAFIAVSTVFGLILFGLIKTNQLSDVVRKKCSDTNCSVKVVDGMCFARIAALDNSQFSRVKCDKKRTGTYNITLPCDVDEDNTDAVGIAINCDEDNYGKFAGSVILFLLNVLFGFLLLATICLLVSVTLNYIEYSKLYELGHDQEDNCNKKEKQPSISVDSECVELEEISKN